MSPAKLDALLGIIGAECDANSDWLDVAMACLDQAGISGQDQVKIEAAAMRAIESAQDAREARAERLAEYAAAGGAS